MQYLLAQTRHAVVMVVVRYLGVVWWWFNGGSVGSGGSGGSGGSSFSHTGQRHRCDRIRIKIKLLSLNWLVAFDLGESCAVINLMTRNHK